jgi:hypothetical protein
MLGLYRGRLLAIVTVVTPWGRHYDWCPAMWCVRYQGFPTWKHWKGTGGGAFARCHVMFKRIQVTVPYSRFYTFSPGEFDKAISELEARSPCPVSAISFRTIDVLTYDSQALRLGEW